MSGAQDPASFTETQRLSPVLGTLTLALIAAVAAVALWQAPAEAWASVLPVLLLSAAPVLAFFLTLTMHTEVRDGAISIRTLYLIRRRIPLDEVTGAEVRRYRPIREFGGWGIRYSRRGRAYNMRGDLGVQLTMSGGKPILIGSQHPEALLAAIRAEKSRG